MFGRLLHFHAPRSIPFISPFSAGTLVLCTSVLMASLLYSETPDPEVGVGRKYPKRVYQITRITGASPVVDGVLDEACWQQGTWDGGFLQREPEEGAVPADETEIKLLYDDEAIYVAMRAYVKDVPNRDKQIGRRDSFAGDMVGIAFDSYFDRRSAFEFDVDRVVARKWIF